MPTIYKLYNESHLEKKSVQIHGTSKFYPFSLVSLLCAWKSYHVPVLRNCIEDNYLVFHAANFIIKLI